MMKTPLTLPTPRLPLLALLAAAPLLAQTEIRPRVMVLVDTSASMGLYFPDPVNFNLPGPGVDYPGGDGSNYYTDSGNTNTFLWPGKRLTGTCTQADLSGCEGPRSRFWAAKRGASQAIYGHGRIDFGLAGFDFQLCPFGTPRCVTCSIVCSGSCSYSCLYTNNTFTALSSVNWNAQGCTAAGARVIAAPGAGSGAAALRWLDGIEDHRSSGDGNNAYGTGSTPLNPELRAVGNSPLGEGVTGLRTGWYAPTAAADPQANCRPYRLILVTDSVESTGGTCGADPVAAVSALYNANPANRVLTSVISLAPDAPTRAIHDQLAAAGGTGQAFYTTNPAEVEQAFARIAASSLKPEFCNNGDDNCDGVTDEGFPDKGNACTVGVGACLRGGVRKCAASTLATACCVNDGFTPCVAQTAGSPVAETCDGLDNDCNGVIDNGVSCAGQ